MQTRGNEKGRRDNAHSTNLGLVSQSLCSVKIIVRTILRCIFSSRCFSEPSSVTLLLKTFAHLRVNQTACKSSQNASFYAFFAFLRHFIHT